MNISEALSNLNTLQVFSNSFTKTANVNLTIARNLVSNAINIRNGTNTIGKLSPYDQTYSVIGGNCTLFNTSIYRGSFYYSGNLASPPPINFNFSNIFKPAPFDFTSFYSQISGYSDFLRTNAENASKLFSGGVYYFSGNNDINYINFNAQDLVNLQTCNSFEFNFKTNSTIILNFYGNDTIYFNNIYFKFLNNLSEANILLNFEDHNVNIIGTLDGNILHTSGTIILNGATVNGSVYGNTITATSTTLINDSVLYGVGNLPIKKLTSPSISVIEDPIYGNITIIITNNDIVGSILYSIDGINYNQYVSDFIITNVGNHIITAYVQADGYETSDTSTNTGLITCECEKPTIQFNSITNTLTFSTNMNDASIYFTLDGTIPTTNDIKVNNFGFYKIPNDGLYEVIAFAANGICSISGNSHKSVLVSYPVEILTIEVLGVANPQGIYPDQGGNGVQVQITKNTASSSKIYYTEDGTDPMVNGVLYSGPFYTKSNKILAVVNDMYYGYSKIAEKEILIGGAFYLAPTNSRLNSLLRSDTISNIPVYCMDIGWIGPTVIVDDTAIYQALVNILSTAIGDIPFNLSFGVSVVRNLFETIDEFNSPQIISQLKTEIEHNDPRILIDSQNSYAYFVEATSQLVIDLAWVSRYTNEKAHVKYGYNLDGIL